MRHNSDRGGVWSFFSDEPAQVMKDEEVYDTEDLAASSSSAASAEDDRSMSQQQRQQRKDIEVGHFTAWSSQPMAFPDVEYPEGSCLSEVDESGATAALARSRLRARLAAGSRMFFVSERYGDRLEDECFSIDSLDHGYGEEEDGEEELVCCPSCGNEFGHVPKRPNRAKASLVERYNRLQYEAALLEADLRKAVEQQTSKAPTFKSNGETLTLSQLAERVSRLSGSLKELPSTVGKSCSAQVGASSGASSPAVEVMVPQAAHVATVADGEEAEDSDDEVAPPRRPNPSKEGKNDTVTLKTLVDLDHRLSVLEKTVGCSDVEAALGAAPLCETVLQWRKRLLVLTAAQLEALKSKIKDVQESMSDLRLPDGGGAAAATASAGEGAGLTAQDLAQVHRVLDNMERWERTRKALPEIVERLRTLAPLHEASASFVERLDEVESKQDSTEKMMNDLQLIVVRLEQSMTLNSKRLADNMQALEARISNPKK